LNVSNNVSLPELKQLLSKHLTLKNVSLMNTFSFLEISFVSFTTSGDEARKAWYEVWSSDQFSA